MASCTTPVVLRLTDGEFLHAQSGLSAAGRCGDQNILNSRAASASSWKGSGLKGCGMGVPIPRGDFSRRQTGELERQTRCESRGGGVLEPAGTLLNWFCYQIVASYQQLCHENGA